MKMHSTVFVPRILVMVGILVCLLMVASACTAEPQAVELIDDNLSPWRGDTGQWMIVGKAIQDPNDPKRIAMSAGTGVLVNGPTGRTLNLLSQFEHADVEAHVEFMVPEGSNSGVYFQGRYEVQILDSWGKEEVNHGDCGGIYERWNNEKRQGFEGRAPRVNASRRPGEWQTFGVVFRAPRFDADGKKVANARFVKVVHNGIVVHENVEVTGPTRAATFSDEAPVGPLMLQGDHGPVAYRNLRLTALPAN